jgi:hypothetical protein
MLQEQFLAHLFRFRCIKIEHVFDFDAFRLRFLKSGCLSATGKKEKSLAPELGCLESDNGHSCKWRPVRVP